MIRIRISILVGLAFGSLLAASRADDWPQFRGPTRDGISAEKNWRAEWPAEGPPVAWKAEVGLGFSSIVVANGRAATAGHAGGKDTVFCFDAASGKPLWKRSYPAELGDKFYEGGTTGTPTFEGDRLYWLSRWGDQFCFDAANGKIVWQTNVQKLTGAPIPTWGYTGAPLVQGDLLVLNVGDAGTAVNKATGKVVWKSAAKDCGYSTPTPVTLGGKALAILSNAENYLAVDPKTGAEAWRQRWVTEYGVNAADPVLADGQMFISTGYGKGGALFKIGPAGSEQLWKTKALRTQLNAAVLYGKHLYGPDGDTGDKAALKCLDFATGKEVWAEPGFGTGGAVVAAGKLIALSANGEIIIAPATPEGFKPITRAQVLAPKCWTAPVLANGLVYCRNQKGQIAVLDLRAK
jgi:outer membrane protein assembly factor BamB